MATILVTSPAGAQGAAIAQAFLHAGHRVRGLARNTPPTTPGIEAFTGDLASGRGLAEAMDGVDTVVFTSPLDYRPGVREAMARHVADAAARQGVRRVVFNPAGPVFDDVDRPVSAVLRQMRAILHAGAVPAVTVQPTVYMDNLLAPWAWSAIVGNGVLPYPMVPGDPVAWVSHRTLAASLVAAATRPGIEGAVFDLGGPETVTPVDVAQRLGRLLGRDVAYQQVPLDAFATSLNGVFGAPVGDDIADLYRLVAARPSRLLRDGSGQRALGVEGERLDDFLARALPATQAA